MVGEGPVDLVFVPGFTSDIEQGWGWPQMADFLRRLASFSRLLIFDRRGTGLSDHIVEGGQSLEVRMDDIRAVMDTAGSERAILLGFEEGFALCAIFAASYPERAVALVGFAGVVASRSTPDFPWGAWDDAEEYLSDVERRWGTIDFAREEGSNIWPDIGDDPDRWGDYATAMRQAVSPGDAEKLLRTDSQTDVRDLLPAIGVPTLLLHRIDDQSLPVQRSRYIAERIAGAVLVELPGQNHGYMAPDQDEVLDEVARVVQRLRAEEAASIRSWRRSCSPTSSDRPRRQRSWGIGRGERSWKDTMRRCGRCSPDTGDARSTRRATASSPPSTGRRAPSGAPRP